MVTHTPRTLLPGLALLLGLVPLGSCVGRGRGADFNGPLLSGTRVGEAQLAAVSLSDGVTLEGKVLRDVTLTGTELKGADAAGFALSGALLLGRSTDGAAVRLRVDGVAQAEDPRPETPDNELEGVQLYTLSFQRGTLVGEGEARHFEPAAGAAYAPLCADGKGALPLAGRWDYGKGQAGDGRRLSAGEREVSFVCPDGALFKCVRLGYRPWQGPELQKLHEACVRAVRADYCGVGLSMTETGTEVNYYDALGVQKDTRDWSFEAEWTAEGARCVSGARRGKAALAHVKESCPERLRACGGLKDGKGEAGVIYTEYKP